MKSKFLLTSFLLSLGFLWGCATKTMYATRLKAPKVFLDPKTFKTISLTPVHGRNGSKMSSALFELIKEKTKLKVISYETLEEGVLKKMWGKKSYEKPDLILKSDYQEFVDYEQVPNVPHYTNAVIEGVLNIELVNNKSGEVLLREKYHHAESTGNYSAEYEPQRAENRRGATREILAQKFIEDLRPSEQGSYYDAYVDRDYPELERGHLLISDRKYTQASELFDSLLNKNIPAEIRGHAFYGKSVALAYEGEAGKAKEYLDQAYKENSEPGYFKLRPLINKVEQDAPILKRFQ